MVNLKNNLITIAAVIFGFNFGLINFEVSHQLPSFVIVMRDLLLCTTCYDFLFYYSHRVLHHPKFYFLHKQHHEISTPVSFAALYTGNFEHIFANVLAIAAGPMLISTHLSTFYIYITLVTITELGNHSGYHLPFLRSAEAHDYHHAK